MPERRALKRGSGTTGSRSQVEQYRALCYLALGDTLEAQHAIETIVAAMPFYRPTGTTISPRLESTFAEVRRRALPTIVRQKYALAKAAYDRSEYDTAAVGFGDVLRLLDDPDLADTAQGSLSDLRVVTDGFVNLSARRTTAATAESRPPVAPVTTKSAGGRKLAEIYTDKSAEVVPPVVINQTFPPYTGALRTALKGAIEVTIGEHGQVIDAKMRTPTVTLYDATVVAAARRWQYKPASVDGTPVKFLKVVYIDIVAPR